VSENFEELVNGVESFGTDKRHENRAGQYDCGDRKNCAESVWSFPLYRRGVEKAINALGKIVIHAG
jgi:hypothetical protein